MDAEPLTDFLRRAQDGDAAAMRVVFDATYPELRTQARARLRRGPRHTLLDTTSLSGRQWIVVLALSLLAPAVVAADKLIQLSRQRKAGVPLQAES